MMYTFSRIDNGMDVVYGTVSVDVSMGGVVGREAETAERAALIQVKHINTLVHRTQCNTKCNGTIGISRVLIRLHVLIKCFLHA